MGVPITKIMTILINDYYLLLDVAISLISISKEKG